MSWRVVYLPTGTTVEVDPRRAPFGEAGRPGSLLDIALGHGVELEHACGGNCACTTCHVHVEAGMENLSPVEMDEEEKLDTVVRLLPTTRLACQAIVRGDVVVRVP